MIYGIPRQLREVEISIYNQNKCINLHLKKKFYGNQSRGVNVGTIWETGR